MISTQRRLAAALAVSLAVMPFAGCSKDAAKEESADPTSTEAIDGYKACMVAGLGGFSDRSFNQPSLEGLQRAAKDLNLQVATAEPKDEKQIPAALEKMVTEGCNLVITVGFELGPATAEIAKQTPTVDFVTVDWFDPKLSEGLRNLRPVVYSATEPAFLAGYLAAATSKTGTIATYGGLPFPSVTDFMNGFQQGAAHWSTVKKRPVKVLGWNPEKPESSTFAGSFADEAKGEQITKDFVAKGADIIFPVAGQTGNGSLAATGSDGKPTIVWVDSDGCVAAPEHCSKIMTSVQKKLDTSVYETVQEASLGRFTAAPYVGTLVNKGVALGDFHEFDDDIPEETKKELAALSTDIVEGRTKITRTAGSAAG